MKTVRLKDPDTGEDVEGVVVKVTDAKEPFSYLTLEDATEITIRSTVTQVVRLLDRWNDNGEPKYHFLFNANLTIQAPSRLKKGGVEDA